MARASRQAIARYEERILAYETRSRPAEPPPARSKAPARHPAKLQTRSQAKRPALPVRLRRIAILTTLLLLGAAVLSFATTMLQPSNLPFGVRAVEWLRDNGAAGLVSKVEAIYYSANAPSTGGPALKKLPNVGVAGVRATDTTYLPPAIAPVISPPLPDEGIWHGTGPLVRGAPPVLVTTFRPDPNYPQMVAGVAWIDSTRAWVQLYPGRYEPPNSGNAAAQVPSSLRNVLLATFNSGFKLEDSHGGFVAFGHVYAPLQDGLATFVRLRDGTADVRAWSGGPTPGPQIEFARQNLPLIVDGGRLNPNLSDGPQWGATLGNAVRVWRSGVGVDGRGNLIYAAADNQTATSLAQILQRAGAVRAMELDINYEWVTFNFYGAFGAVNASKLLSGMSRDVTRYLSPDDRDFFAVYARNG
jgi:Phosphodiester glycosidase